MDYTDPYTGHTNKEWGGGERRMHLATHSPYQKNVVTPKETLSPVPFKLSITILYMPLNI